MEKKIKLIKRFKSYGRTCIVIEFDVNDEMKKKFKEISNEVNKKLGTKGKGSLEKLYPYCNGYIETRDKRHYDNIPVSEELTFKRELINLRFEMDLDDLEGKEFVGFDTCHNWNELKPLSKQPKSVIKRCRKVAKELNKVEKIGILRRIFGGIDNINFTKRFIYVWGVLLGVNGYMLFRNPNVINGIMVGWCVAFLINTYNYLKMCENYQKLINTLIKMYRTK